MSNRISMTIFISFCSLLCGICALYLWLLLKLWLPQGHQLSSFAWLQPSPLSCCKFTSVHSKCEWGGVCTGSNALRWQEWASCVHIDNISPFKALFRCAAQCYGLSQYIFGFVYCLTQSLSYHIWDHTVLILALARNTNWFSQFLFILHFGYLPAFSYIILYVPLGHPFPTLGDSSFHETRLTWFSYYVRMVWHSLL